MTVLFEEMTREQIKKVAPEAIAVLPTAATEQHGPHMAVGTDTLLCTTVAKQAAEAAAGQVPVVITPPLAFGSSHHHIPFGGVLSLTSDTFIDVVREVAQGLVRTGFRKVVILNGHGGNSDHVGVAGQDLVNRMDMAATVASCNYWDIGKPALVEKGLLEAGLIPGHAGHFETSLIMALRPDWVDPEGMAKVEDQSGGNSGLDVGVAAAVVQTYGVWQKGPGHTDNPAAASPELGRDLLAVLVDQVAQFYRDFHAVAGPAVD
ncbi:MAG: creatininase family protein [Candidatus Latescibacteria bacterium]|nr:creatininase family protein [Candidatus Latescibacterota bacterium]